jgi:CHAD domain-containing protein
MIPISSIPESWKSQDIDPEDAMAEAGRKVLRYHFLMMLIHEDGTRMGEDIEELHDMRVATRRMRAAFRVFGSAFKKAIIKPCLKGAQATRKALGDVRDLDVFMAKARSYSKTLPEEQGEGLGLLINLWRDEREQARKDMIKYLDSDDYKRFTRAFYDFLSTPGAGVKTSSKDQIRPYKVAQIAPVYIYQMLANVRAYETILESATMDQLHSLRIAIKRLRYAVEFFESVLGESAGEVIDDLKKIQDHLGDLNDARVACQILSEFLTNRRENHGELPSGVSEDPEPIFSYMEAKRKESKQLRETFPSAWEYFNRQEFRENLALAVCVL